MLRDGRKTKDYYDKWIDYDLGKIFEKKVRLESGEIPIPYGKVTATYDLCNKAAGVMVMRYSRGDRLVDLRENALVLLDKRIQLKRYCDELPPDEQKDRVMYERLSFDNYGDYLWWLSFAVCLEMDKTYIQKTLALIGNAGQDALLDRIAEKLGDRRAQSADLKFPKNHAVLLQALDAAPEDQPLLIKKYLDGWYKANKQSAWYARHLEDDTGYVGYWCFEAALVVKLFGIDDASFRDHVYYPADLAHGV